MPEHGSEIDAVFGHCLDCRRGVHQDCLGPAICGCTHTGLDDLQDPDAFGHEGEPCPDKTCSAINTRSCQYPGWRLCLHPVERLKSLAKTKPVHCAPWRGMESPARPVFNAAQVLENRRLYPHLFRP